MFLQGKDNDHARPYENDAIIHTIHQEFFSYCSKAIDKDYPERFPGARNTWKLSNTTIALAATGVSLVVQQGFNLNKHSRFVLHWMSGRVATGSYCHLQQMFTRISMCPTLLLWPRSSKKITKLIQLWSAGCTALPRMLKTLYNNAHVLIFVSGEVVPVAEAASKIDIDNMPTEI